MLCHIKDVSELLEAGVQLVDIGVQTNHIGTSTYKRTSATQSVRANDHTNLICHNVSRKLTRSEVDRYAGGMSLWQCTLSSYVGAN